jgi:hypothetical protein
MVFSMRVPDSVLDDEEDVSSSSKPAENLMSLPRGAAAINRGPKNEMEDRHTVSGHIYIYIYRERVVCVYI